MGNYEQAISLIFENIEMMDYFGECSDSLIRLAEEALGVRYPDDYRDFVSRFGAGNFGSSEIYGVFKEDFENSSVPDSVWLTLLEREEIGLPHYLVIIYELGNGELYCLNYDKLNSVGEPTVTAFVPNGKPNTDEILYESFGDFLLNIVTGELE
ncbi:hypothetical protein BU202_02980 [Streptococcus cuniculi]|uniref:Knr4/Smi1-like domain-containing protein n=1 Tax=Streptococcus cuniculi TaxID=1432788 RepID=A0A1Q8E9Z0_9STRE|nr:SMI1/KNR4 family protein [Streptococcus cuniculi]OLF48597.1 hypothetical protein BU202_02980 [Streptococcus cuniculi]